jgi:hypothetical protein
MKVPAYEDPDEGFHPQAWISSFFLGVSGHLINI